MLKLAILASGLAVLVSLWVIGTKVGTAQVNSNDPRIALVDNCDPVTFTAAFGPGVCVSTPHKLDTPFAEFFALLSSPLSAAVVGHPAWRFDPGYVSIRAGQTVFATNTGGEGHTFTEVAAYGGGFVPFPPLNFGLATAPACVPPPGTTIVAPGQTSRITGLAPGVHKFQCCIHPWMRAVVDVE